MGRSRKRKDKMNRIKRERNSKKILIRLKKTLGMIDEKGNELMKEVEKVAVVKDPEYFKNKRLDKQLEILGVKKEKAHIFKIKNEKTDVVHVWNSSTMRDQFGNIPSWMSGRHSKKKQQRKLKSKKKNHNPFWRASNVIPM